MQKYTVVYLWRGERYRDITFTDQVAAEFRAEVFRKDGWVAWVEQL